VLDRCIAAFTHLGLPVAVTRDWHPADHCSFREQGGPWPAHCIVETAGAGFAPGLTVPADALIVSKATDAKRESYSDFAGTGLGDRLRALGVKRVFVGGLATDYCVLNTVRDALREGFAAFLLADAIRAVNVNPDDGAQAIAAMEAAGAVVVTADAIAPAPPAPAPPGR
jgi:nicotinamidase/pyrazinamidase